MSAYWPKCPCGDMGWRYYLASGRTGWRCGCGADRPDQLELGPAAPVVVQLPDPVELPGGQFALFDPTQVRAA